MKASPLPPKPLAMARRRRRRSRRRLPRQLQHALRSSLSLVPLRRRRAHAGRAAARRAAAPFGCGHGARPTGGSGHRLVGGSGVGGGAPATAQTYQSRWRLPRRPRVPRRSRRRCRRRRERRRHHSPAAAEDEEPRGRRRRAAARMFGSSPHVRWRSAATRSAARRWSVCFTRHCPRCSPPRPRRRSSARRCACARSSPLWRRACSPTRLCSSPLS